MFSETAKIGISGVFVIPEELRLRFGLEEGSLVIAEEHEDGILLRPVIAIPIELYSNERTAEFLLTNAVDTVDYEKARKEVVAMGMDPELIPHRKPLA